MRIIRRAGCAGGGATASPRVPVPARHDAEEAPSRVEPEGDARGAVVLLPRARADDPESLRPSSCAFEGVDLVRNRLAQHGKIFFCPRIAGYADV